MPTSYVDGSGGSLIGGTATVTFTNGAPGKVNPDLKFLWDLDNDGDFSESVEDITGYVMAAEAVSGRDWPSNLQGKAAPGTLQLTLLNEDNRFSHFNTASPLNTAPFSLGTGRKIRVQATGAGNPDPTLLARDRFRVDGALQFDETGEAWTERDAGFTKLGGRATFAPGTVATDTAISTVDVGVNDYYAQVTSEHIDTPSSGTGQHASIIYRWQDASNYGEVQLSAGTLIHRSRVAGVNTDTTVYEIETNNHRHCTFGVHAHSTTADIYVEGVQVASLTAVSFTGGHVGIKAFLGQDQLRFPALEELWVFSGVPTIQSGIIWTGAVASVFPAAPVAGVKTATLVAEGALAKLANVDVEISGSVGAAQNVIGVALVGGRRMGIALGHVLNQAGLATPPGRIDEGDVKSGSFGFSKSNALELARQFEEAERGFLHESNEGPLSFTERSARAIASSKAGFSDAVGGQFTYSEIVPFDWRKEIINQVSAGLSPLRVIGSGSNTSGSTAAGVDNNIAFTNPAVVTRGDLLIVIIASTVRSTDRHWNPPSGWTALRHPGDQANGFSLGIFYKIAKDNDAGQSLTFLNDAAAGGAWAVNAYRFQEWYGTAQGLEIGTVATAIDAWGDANSDAATPPPLAPSWGPQFPTMFIAAMAGWSSAAGGSYPSPQPPSGYGSLISNVVNGAVNNFDVACVTATRSGIAEIEKPTAFNPLAGYETVQSVLLAVRGRNGPSPIRQSTPTDGTLAEISTSFFTFESNHHGSQDSHGGIRTYRSPANMFHDETDVLAYNDSILDGYADDRPIFSISYEATVNQHHRQQAIDRRVGDKITLTATGDTGMGVQGDFFIEKIAHQWPNPKLWKVTYELSPA